MPTPLSPAAAATRIAIVGAGAGGLSLARILTDRGLGDVTVLERAPRVGGKAWTFVHEGVPHELGTCYQTWGYTHVRDWMAEAGIGAHRLHRHRIHLPDGGVQDFKDFVLGPDKVAAYAQLAEYNTRWLSFFSHQQLGTDAAAWSADVARPFGAWLDGHGLEVVKRFAWRTMTAMGYGHVERVPALYGLRWNTPSLLLSAAALRVDEPVPGWQALWEHLAWRLDVRLSTRIRAVTRGPRGHVVHTDQGDLACDHLVVSTPLDEAAAWLPLSAEEQAAFAPLRWSEYVSTLVVARGWFQAEDTHTFAENLYGADGARRGHLLVARRTGDKTAVAAARPARPDAYVCYQVGGPDLSQDELHERLRADIAGQGGHLERVVTGARWRYAPQLPAEVIAAGGARALDEVQGRLRTWYTGASLSHEAVDPIVDHNTWLADRIEHRVRLDAGEPLDEDWLLRRRRKQLLSLHNK